MLKTIVKMLMHFSENCIFLCVKIVTFGARQLLEKPNYSHPKLFTHWPMMERLSNVHMGWLLLHKISIAGCKE